MILAAGVVAQASYSAVAIGLPALAPALRAHYGLSLSQVGVVLGACAGGLLVTTLPWGLAADRIGERAVIALGLAGAAGSLVGVAWAGRFGSLAGLLAVSGLFGGSVNAASGRAVMSWFAPDERGLALGIRQTSIPLGAAIAAATLPRLANLGGTRLAFLALAAGCLAGGVVAALLLRDEPLRGRGAPAAAPVVNPLRDRTTWRLSCGGAAYLTAQVAITGFVVLFLNRHRGLSRPAAADVLAVTQVLGGLARIVAGLWSDRTGTRVRPLRSLGLLLVVGTLAVAALVDAPLPVLVPVFVVAGVVSLSWNGLAFTAIAEAAAAGRSGAALGLQQAIFATCGLTIPIVFAAIVGASSWRVGFALAAVGPLLGVAVLRSLTEARTPARR